MAKQRFVIYKAINKEGKVERSLLVAGGKMMPFIGDVNWKFYLRATSYNIMTNFCSSFKCAKEWKQFAMYEGACRFQKVIYFN